MDNLILLQDILYGVMSVSNSVILAVILLKAKLFNDYYTRLRVAFSIALGLGLFLDIQPVYLFVDALTLNNFAWVLSWSLKITAIAAATLITIRLSQTDVPWLIPSLGAYYLITALFYAVIWDHPVNSLRLQAYDSAELLLMSLMLGYSMVLAFLFTYLVAKSMLRLKHVEERFRSVLGVITGISAGAFFMTRLATVWVVQFQGFSEAAYVFYVMSLVWTILPGAVMPFLLNLQNRSLGTKVQASFIWFTYLVQVRWLRVLQSQLDKFCPSLRAPINLIEIIKSPALCVYQQMIDIFDRKHILNTYLEVLSSQNHDAAVVMQDAYYIHVWDDTKQQDAVSFVNRLMQIDDNKPFNYVINDYSHIAKTLDLEV